MRCMGLVDGMSESICLRAQSTPGIQLRSTEIHYYLAAASSSRPRNQSISQDDAYKLHSSLFLWSVIRSLQDNPKKVSQDHAYRLHSSSFLWSIFRSV